MLGLRFVAISVSLLCACGSATPDADGGGKSGAPAGGSAQAGGPANGGGATSGSSAGGASAGSPNNSAGTPSGGAASGGLASTGGSAGSVSMAGSPSAGSGGSPPGSGTCSREVLTAAADSYVAALVAGDPTKMMLASGATNVENKMTVAIGEGILKTALPVAFHRNLLDVEQCETFSEIIITEGGHPYVIGTQLKLTGGAISALDALITDDGDWLFDAAGYLKHSKAESWEILPAEQQISRDELIAAANSYFDLFNDKTIMVPWGTPCDRLEGGKAYTGGTCDVGVPEGITFANKHFVVDIPMGTAVGLVRFGGANGLPDSHMFRVPSGKIRYVHTITVCPAAGCTG